MVWHTKPVVVVVVVVVVVAATAVVVAVAVVAVAVVVVVVVVVNAQKSTGRRLTQGFRAVRLPHILNSIISDTRLHSCCF